MISGEFMGLTLSFLDVTTYCARGLSTFIYFALSAIPVLSIPLAKNPFPKSDYPIITSDALSEGFITSDISLLSESPAVASDFLSENTTTSEISFAYSAPITSVFIDISSKDYTAPTSIDIPAVITGSISGEESASAYIVSSYISSLSTQIDTPSPVVSFPKNSKDLRHHE